MHFNLLLHGRRRRSGEEDSHTQYRQYQEYYQKYDKNVRAFVRIENAVRNIKYLVEYPRISGLPIFLSHSPRVANPGDIAQRFCTRPFF